MKINAFGPLDKAVKVLDVLTTKQEIIADNITNMDTPGYVRKDINFSNYLNSSGSSLEKKLEEKLGSGLIAMEASGPVDAAQEIASMQQNYVLYSMATRKMKSTITELRADLKDMKRERDDLERSYSSGNNIMESLQASKQKADEENVINHISDLEIPPMVGILFQEDLYF